MTEKPRTFEEWWVYPIPVSFDEQDAFRAARRAWRARDEEVAAKDRRIEELEGHLASIIDVMDKHGRGSLSQKTTVGNVVELLDKVLAADLRGTIEFQGKLNALQTQIDRVRAALDLDGDWESREHAIRSALDKPAAPRCIGYPKCDGNLVAEPHSEECPLYRSEPTAKEQKR